MIGPIAHHSLSNIFQRLRSPIQSIKGRQMAKRTLAGNMVQSQCLLLNRECPQQELLGFLVFTEIVGQYTHVVEIQRNRGMLAAESFFRQGDDTMP